MVRTNPDAHRQEHIYKASNLPCFPGILRLLVENRCKKMLKMYKIQDWAGLIYNILLLSYKYLFQRIETKYRSMQFLFHTDKDTELGLHKYFKVLKINNWKT